MDVFIHTRYWVSVAGAFLTACVWLAHQPSLPGNMVLIAGWGAMSVALKGVIQAQKAHSFGLRKSGMTDTLVVFALVGGCAFLIGLTYATRRAELAIDTRLPAVLEGSDIRVRAEVDGLVEAREHGLRLALRNIEILDSPVIIKGRLRVAWYGARAPVVAGQQWELTLRLRRFRSRYSDGAFDIERWSLANGFSGTGYVRNSPSPRLLQASQPNVSSLRQSIANTVVANASSERNASVLVALAVGDRSRVDAELWQKFRDTGTSHLVAISGLHVGFVAWLSGYLALWGLRRSHAVCRRWSARQGAVLCAIPCAFLYSALAGFAVSTQRALIMLIVVSLALLLRRRMDPWRSLSQALIIVLLINPMAPLGAGFWLSFTAVAAIMTVLQLGTGAGPAPEASGQGDGWLTALQRLRATTVAKLRAWLSVQLGLSVGLMPMTLLVFSEASLVSVFANAIAIPLTAFAVVPALLFSLILYPVSELAFAPVFILADWGVSALLYCIDLAAAVPMARFETTRSGLFACVLATFGTLMLFLPHGVPGRLAGVLLWLPLVFVQPARVSGTLIDVLDVGQGLAVVVRSQGEVLVYDTGNRYGNTSDGARIVIPWLKHHGIERIDTLVVSHADSDHAGGALDVIRAMQPRRVLAGMPEQLRGAQACERGDAFTLGDINVDVLSPAPGASGSDNNRSCVLHLRFQCASFLLTGDIGAQAETTIVAQHGARLPVTGMLVPHHGARTSSTLPFLGATSPQFAVVSAGYRNRHGHPAKRVLDRYRAHGIRVYATGQHGSVRLHWPIHASACPPHALPVVEQWIDKNRRYWHNTVAGQ